MTATPTLAHRPTRPSSLPLVALVVAGLAVLLSLVGTGASVAVALSAQSEAKQVKKELDSTRSELATVRAERDQDNRGMLLALDQQSKTFRAVLEAQEKKNEQFQAKTMEALDLIADRLNKKK